MDLTLALRGMRRSPGFAALVAGTMAIGIAANTTMYSLARAVFLRPLPYRDEARLMTIWEQDTGKGINDRRVTPHNFVDWQAQSKSVEAWGVLPNWTGPSWKFNVVSADGVQQIPGIYASSGFFRVMGVQPFVGRVLDDADDQFRERRHVVIGYRYWQDHLGGDRRAIGKTLQIDTFRGGAFEIVGVMPPSFDLPHDAQLWLSLGDWGAGPFPPPDSADRCCAWYSTVAKLRPGVSPSEAAAELTGIAQRISERHSTSARATGVKVTPLRETLVGGYRSTGAALFGAVVCVLLIGCANVANLLLSRGVGRRREMATRAALGATRWRIARQLLVEGLALNGAGALAGVWIAIAVRPVLAAFLADRIPLADPLATDWTVLGFAAALAALSGLLCGLAPLAQWGGTSLASRGQTDSPLSRALRRGLVVGEVALSVMLVAAAGLFIRTVENLGKVDMGFQTGRLLTVSTDLTTGPLRSRGNSVRFLETLLPQLSALPGVRRAAVTTTLPFEAGPATQPITPDDRQPRSSSESPQVIQTAVSPGFFESMGMQLRAGRGLSDFDRADGKLVAVINETAAHRYWPGRNPIGARFAIGSAERYGSFRPPVPGQIEWREVVGIVSDIRSRGQSAPVEPEVYYSYRQFPIYDPTIVIQTEGEPEALAPAVRRTIAAADRNAVIVRVRAMETVAAAAIAGERMRAGVAGAFSLVAVALGMLGVYGLMAYTVSQQSREIGIRMALGAQPSQVSRAVLRVALTITGAGAALGLVLSTIATRWISTMLFGVPPNDPATLFAACVALAFASILASYLPARRASQIDPASALRLE